VEQRGVSARALDAVVGDRDDYDDDNATTTTAHDDVSVRRRFGGADGARDDAASTASNGGDAKVRLHGHTHLVSQAAMSAGEWRVCAERVIGA
jgi:hypothetical protein